MATPSIKKSPWLNPQMLRWAREWRGRTLEEAAAKIDKSPDVLAAWENGQGAPTVRQARILANFYERPFLELVLPNPPKLVEPASIPDYRMQRGEVPPTRTRDIALIQQWAETQRINALDLYDELYERPAEIPTSVFTTIRSDTEKAAESARQALSFTIQDQISLRQSDAERLPSILRRKFEALGILALRRTDLKDHGIRGICLAIFPLPVIVFRNEAPSAQAFTLAHELAHILVKQSGITGPRVSQYKEDPTEKWADQFAGSFLMPVKQLEAIHGAGPSRPAKEISDETLARLAEVFRVSPHAMLIRLVHLGYVQSEYYWLIKKPQFDAQERDYKAHGRSKYYGSRYKSKLGDLYTGLVLEAWSLGRITNHNAAEYLGIKNLDHLRDIRDNYGVP
jgi:Zn-dependent peptidase ImmA (M78 family)/transcriptional regulator with XRE-family HTH domain